VSPSVPKKRSVHSIVVCELNSIEQPDGPDDPKLVSEGWKCICPMAGMLPISPHRIGLVEPGEQAWMPLDVVLVGLDGCPYVEAS